MARPTELTPEIIAKADTYLEGCKGIEVHTLLPTIEGLAIACGIHRDTVYDWENVPPAPENPTRQQVYQHHLRTQFSDIVKDLRASQAQKLMQNSLVNRYNPMIAKLLLSRHGYVEESKVDQKTELSGKVSLEVETKTDEELDEIINGYTKQTTSSGSDTGKEASPSS